MHPILARGYRLALYLLVWLGVGGLLARAIARPGGLDVSQAAAIILPLSVLYGFVCLSSWYVCRATPIRTAGLLTLVANLGGATVFASTMWAVAGRAWAWVVSQAPGFAGAREAFARDTFLLFVVDALLYIVMIATHYVMIAAEESRAADQRVLQIQLLAREAELKALKAQIEPHFLFNSLNSISALATADPPGARRMCVLLGEFLRASLKLGLHERIPLADELALVRRYFEIEQVRFGARLRFEQTVEDGIGECLVPPLLLQPLAENAVGHGIAQTLEGGTVRLEARRQDGALRIAIENPVDRDQPKNARGGVGLDNVRRRLATHYAGRAALDIDQRPESFLVTITMPYGLNREQGPGIRDQGQGPGIRDQGSGTRDQGSGIRDQGPGIRDRDQGQGPGTGTRDRDQGSGIRDQGPGIRDQGAGTREQGPGTRDQGPGSRDQGPGTREQGSGTGDQGPGTRAPPSRVALRRVNGSTMTDGSLNLRVVIVDDEDLARAVVREHLAAYPEIEIIAECANGFEAVKAVTELRPDLVFLDVQMPKLDGFEVLELIGREVAVVFVTAYDEYALRAFEVHAVDYLLKPFSEERLAEAIAHARQHLGERGKPPIAPLVAAARPPGQATERLVVRDGARVHVILVERLDYVQAQDDYVCLYSEGKGFLKEQTMAEIEATLDPARFVRIHRSYILNIERLTRVEPYGKDSRVAILADGTRLPVSRTGYARLNELL